MALIAPPIREIRVTILAANFAQIEWDRIGSNFRYEVHLRGGSSIETQGDWRRIGYTENIDYFLDDNIIQPNTYYQFRVRAVYKDFDPGEWTESDQVLSYAINAYSYTTQDNFALSKPFMNKFFAANDKTYLDVENDTLYATLVRPGFEFDPNVELYSEEGNSFVRNNGFQVVYNEVPVVCHSQERVIPTVIDDVIYAFERFQNICKVSNDGGQTWHVYEALRGRAGNPVYNCIAQQNSTNTFVLGWDYMYQGIPSLSLTFDNDRVRWSSVEYTFENLDVENPFGFDTERFTPLAPIPVDIRTKAEAFSVDDYQLIVAAEDTMYEYVIRDPSIEDDPTNTDYGSRVFEDRPWRITGVDDAVIKKIDFYKNPDIGVDLGTFYFLVPGVWVRNTDVMSPEFGKKIAIDDTHAVRGVYKMNRAATTIPNPDFDPTKPSGPENPIILVTGFNIIGFTKVYGNTPEELQRITNETTLSRDEKQLIIGVELSGWEVVEDDRPPEGYIGVRYYKEQLFTSYQKRFLQAIGTIDGINFAPRVQDYYGSAQYNWMDRSGTRDYKDWQNQTLYIRPTTTFTVPFNDSPSSRWSYTFTEGQHIITCPDLTIREFSGYTDGALIHTQSGKMLGYYKFTYRINSPAPILWVNNSRILEANLVNYTPVVIPEPESDIDYVIDPEISPLLNKMVPATYIPEDGLYKKFCEYYMQFISKGSGTAYNNLFNLMNSKYARDKHYTEYLYKEIYARNQVLDAQKREDITKFFLAHRSDFYSTKGIINSYKFLFKLLYNERVEVEVESLNRFEYFITVSSNDMTDDMVGRRIYTTTGSADITYFERQFVDGIPYYKLTLNNLIGQFNKGQVISSQWDLNFDALVYIGIQGDKTNYNSEDFKNRSKSYYVMKIRSEVQASQYKADIIRFIHPIGFNFIGITLLTVLINQGVSIEHNETIVDFFNSLRFDMGAGTVYPDRIPLLDSNGDLQYNIKGEVITQSHPQGGQFIPLDETAYNNSWNNEMIWGLLPYDRRGTYAPTFDASWVRWCELVTKLSDRLKDNIGNYYDPVTPTQVNVPDAD